MMLTLSEAARLAGGMLTGSGEAVIARVTTDSRSLREGDLFVAIKGERFDGHDFAAAALEQGAAGVIVDEGFAGEQDGLIRVEDTRLALGHLAAGWRARFAVPLAGITGSNGKTTVKEMLASILRAHAGQDAVLVTAGNFNNDIGLPLTLLGLNDTHRYAVIEMGMNHSGELSYLTGLARPDVALVNNALRAHLGCFDSVESIARAKSEIYVRLPVPGEHNVKNALAAAALALALDVPLATIGRGLTGFSGVGGRLQKKTARNGAQLIDDTYNANPDSMRAGLEVLSRLRAPRWFVMGDMGELGETADALHAEVGRAARELNVDMLVTLGNASRHASDAFGAPARHFDALEPLLAWLDSALPYNATVLVKGSHFMNMDRVVDHLVGQKGE